MIVRQFGGIYWFRSLQKSRFAVSILNAGTGAGKAVISAAGSRMGVRNMYLFMGGAAQTFGTRSASGFGRVRWSLHRTASGHPF